MIMLFGQASIIRPHSLQTPHS